jgi:hypothetical protein
MKRIILCCLVFLCYGTCEATLVHVDGPVYTTNGLYAGKAWWYMDMGQLYNKTVQQQLDFIGYLNQTTAYGFSSWRIADAGEIFDVVDLYWVGGPKNIELANILGLNKTQKAYLRFREYDNTYDEISLDYYDAGTGYEQGWRTGRFSTPTDPYHHLGAFVIAVPEPISLCFLAVGCLFLKQRKHQ